jgi:hypothetical protein
MSFSTRRLTLYLELKTKVCIVIVRHLEELRSWLIAITFDATTPSYATLTSIVIAVIHTAMYITVTTIAIAIVIISTAVAYKYCVV